MDMRPLEDVTSARGPSSMTDAEDTWLRRSIAIAPDAVVVADAAGRILLSNEHAAELFGYSVEELHDLGIEDLMPTRFRHSHAANRERYQERPRTRSMGTRDMELFGVRKDGREFPADVSLSPIRLGEGVVAIAAIRDITARKELESALREAKDSAEAAHRELESFSYSVAHDLRAPIRRIDLCACMLRDDEAAVLSETGGKQLDTICSSTRRMIQVIDALLALSKVTRADVAKEDVDVSEIARTLLDELRAANSDRIVNVSVDASIIVRGDRALLRIALENLLRNAWKFTSKREDARVEVGESTHAGERTIFVRDNGAGFDMKLASKLFRPFQRLHPTVDFDGTGIGLATVARIIQRHGGRIWANSAPQKGAEFIFTLGDSGATTVLATDR